MKFSNRELTALRWLTVGGYFKEALEPHFRGGMRFKVHLYTPNHNRVTFVGRATLTALVKAGLIDSEHSCAGTVCHYRLTSVTAWQPEVAIAFDTAMEQAS